MFAIICDWRCWGFPWSRLELFSGAVMTSIELLLRRNETLDDWWEFRRAKGEWVWRAGFFSGAFWIKRILKKIGIWVEILEVLGPAVIYLFLALHLEHKLKYCLHCMYMNTIPPVKPTVTTTNFVQNGQPSFPFFTSSAERSINTQRLQMTQSAAARWKRTAQKSRRRSTPDISKLRHCNKKE